MSAPPPDPPSWPHDGRRSTDDMRDVLTDLRVAVAEFRGETRGRFEQLNTQIAGQVERLEERIADERHSRKTTDATLSGLAQRVEKLDDEVDDTRMTLAKIAPPAAGIGLLAAWLFDVLPRVV